MDFDPTEKLGGITNPETTLDGTLDLIQEDDTSIEETPFRLLDWQATIDAMLVHSSQGDTSRIGFLDHSMGEMNTVLQSALRAVEGRSLSRHTGTDFVLRAIVPPHSFPSLFLFDSHSDHLLQLHEKHLSASLPIWNSAEDLCAFSASSANTGRWGLYLHSMESPSSGAAPLLETDHAIQPLDWSPLSDRLLLLATKPGMGQHLYQYHIEAEDLQRLHPYPDMLRFGPALFSPTGMGVFLVSNETGDQMGLSYLNLATGQQIQLTGDLPGDVTYLRFSPSGDFLAFSVHGSDEDEVFLLKLDTYEREKLNFPFVGRIQFFRFHPHKPQLVVFAGESHHLTDCFFLDISTGDWTQWKESKTSLKSRK